jgi:hypothetical protein
VYTVLCLNILPASYILLVYKPDSKTKRNFRVSRPVNVFVHVFTFINSTYFSFSHADKHPVILNISLASDVWIFFTRESSVLYWLSREHLLSEKCRSIIQALNPDTKVIFSIILQFTQNNCSPVIGISTSISIERKWASDICFNVVYDALPSIYILVCFSLSARAACVSLTCDSPTIVIANFQSVRTVFLMRDCLHVYKSVYNSAYNLINDLPAGRIKI